LGLARIGHGEGFNPQSVAGELLDEGLSNTVLFGDDLLWVPSFA
jgi:hypothetical protein